MKFEILKKSSSLMNNDYENVNNLALSLLKDWTTQEIKDKISEIHILNAKSQEIQEILYPIAIKWGFSSEKKGLFINGFTSGLRPDYYKKLSNNSGIIMEVERGKTLTNNMDLLDIWKCHICQEANFLFLVIPQFRQTGKGKKTVVFDTVVKRLSTFFQQNNYINVEAIFIFGY